MSDLSSPAVRKFKMSKTTCGEYAVAICHEFMNFVPPETDFTFEDFVVYATENHEDFIEEILPERPELSTDPVRKEDMTDELMEEWSELIKQSLVADMVRDSREYREKYITEFLSKAWVETGKKIPLLHDLHPGGVA